MRKIHGLIISLLVLTLTACQKNEVSTDKPEEEKNYYQEINDINVLDKNATKFIDEEITSDSRIVFSADTPEDAIPKVGTGIFPSPKRLRMECCPGSFRSIRTPRGLS